ncbi:hypothetical protein ABZP36_027912, partial [Zizania latifolia]
CSPGEEFYFQESEQQLRSSQIQHHINQISMHMSMDDEPAAAYGGALSNGASSMVDDFLIGSSTLHATGSFHSSSSSFLSPLVSCSPESSASHVLAGPAAAAGFHYPEVSSQAPSLGLAPLVPYEAPHPQYTGLTSPAEMPSTGSGAFRRYARHLGPRRPPKPGACGQRMFKAAMSALAKMNMAMRYSRQYYNQQAVSAAEAEPAPAGNQLQHMISERKRREKLNDSFVALKAVLPPGRKKDKTSILIRAREYVKSLESKLTELEEKNRALEAQLASRARAAVAKDEDETAPTDQASRKVDQDVVELEVTSGGAGAAAGEEESTETCTLNVAVTTPPSRGGGGIMSTTDVVLRTLQCLREQIGDGASLVAMSTSAGSGGRPPRANLTLQLKV